MTTIAPAKKTRKSTRQVTSSACDGGTDLAPAAASNKKTATGPKKAGKSATSKSKAKAGAAASATGAKKVTRVSKAAAKKNAKQTLMIDPALTSDAQPRTTRSQPVFRPVSVPPVIGAFSSTNAETDQPEPSSHTDGPSQGLPSVVRSSVSVTGPLGAQVVKDVSKARSDADVEVLKEEIARLRGRVCHTQSLVLHLLIDRESQSCWPHSDLWPTSPNPNFPKAALSDSPHSNVRSAWPEMQTTRESSTK